ncbi:MAG TPA: branched-chain-amino-acid transaminase [Spirochaetia bacterium]|nr:branched-chain-amino-acid transaminase [Spirochaetia bacterium]
MASGFTLSMYPWVYVAQYTKNGRWDEVYQEKPHKTQAEEDALPEAERDKLLAQRNSFPELPLVNYTTQYGMGCFEGLKAFPQKNGGLKIFRPDENARRMRNSMEGLMMPPFPPELFIKGVKEVAKRNNKLGFAPKYDASWERDDYMSGHSMYIRPFTYSEPGIGVNLSYAPWVIVVATPVGSYFAPGSSKAVTTDKVRAFPGGTGWIKTAANYVIPALVKKQAEAEGYMECIFLDSKERKYVEEGSSCNVFFLLKSGTLVTPALGDTILPGITRKSIITLAKGMGIPVEERKISVEEALDDSEEVFLSGTAAAIAPIESLTHKGKTAKFRGNNMGEKTRAILKTLKGIQYGAIDDTFGWMFDVNA